MRPVSRKMSGFEEMRSFCSVVAITSVTTVTYIGITDANFTWRFSFPRPTLCSVGRFPGNPVEQQSARPNQGPRRQITSPSAAAPPTLRLEGSPPALGHTVSAGRPGGYGPGRGFVPAERLSRPGAVRPPRPRGRGPSPRNRRAAAGASRRGGAASLGGFIHWASRGGTCRTHSPRRP